MRLSWFSCTSDHSHTTFENIYVCVFSKADTKQSIPELMKLATDNGQLNKPNNMTELTVVNVVVAVGVSKT